MTWDEESYDEIRGDLPDVSWWIDKAFFPKCHIYVYFEQAPSGRYYERMFYVRIRGGRPSKIFEIARRIEGEKGYLIKDGVYSGIAGYYVRDLEFSERWYYVVSGISPSGFYNTEHINELVAKDESLKYSGFFYRKMLEPLEYITYYREYPKLEVLAKWGYDWLIRSHTYLNLEGHTFQQVTKLPKLWEPYLLTNGVGTLQSYCKKGLMPEDIEKIKDLKSLFSGIYGKLHLDTRHKILKLYDIIEPKSWEYRTIIRDYYNYCIQENKDLTDEYWLFPKDYKEKHDYFVRLEQERKEQARLLQEQKDIEELKEINVGIKRAYKKHFFKDIDNELTLETADSVETIIRNGGILKICVGSKYQHYMKNMAENKNIIIFGYANNKLEVCIEYDWKNNEILQIRSYSNGESKYRERYERMILSDFNGREPQQMVVY